MMSSTAAVLDETAELGQECLDARTPVALNKTGCVMTSLLELLQGQAEPERKHTTSS
jgi:hypothetical protein